MSCPWSFFCTFVVICAILSLLCCIWLSMHVRLLCSGGYSGKNIGVGCHALLQGIFWPRGQKCITCETCIVGRFFTAEWPGKPPELFTGRQRITSRISGSRKCKLWEVKGILWVYATQRGWPLSQQGPSWDKQRLFWRVQAVLPIQEDWAAPDVLFFMTFFCFPSALPSWDHHGSKGTGNEKYPGEFFFF